MNPVGVDGELRPNLQIEKTQAIASCEDYRKSKTWARNVLGDFVIQYNFLRNHATLGKKPAQATGLNLPIEKGWGDMIQWSASLAP